MDRNRNDLAAAVKHEADSGLSLAQLRQRPVQGIRKPLCHLRFQNEIQMLSFINI